MQNQASTLVENSNATRKDRLYYLDWLRVLAILSVFFLHCSKIFDYNTTVVFNTVRSSVLSAYREFGFLWIMPLFFVLSGAAVFLSLRSRGKGEFIKARIIRLLIPLVLVGTFVINSLYVYIERLFSGQAASGFIEWYPHFFDGINGFGGNFAPLGQGTHLWYLEFLFVYSLILLPLFIRSRKPGISYLSKLSIHFENPWALFLLFLPISAASALFELIGLGGVRVMGGWDPLSYLLFFAYGYLMYSNTQIQETIRKYGSTFFVVSLILTILYVDSHFGFNLRIPGVTRHDLLNNGASLPLNHSVWIAVQALRGLLAWCWIIGLLGLGCRFLNFNNKFLVYSNEAVLPFYILHHTVIYIIGFYVIQWSSGVGTKFLVISITSFVAIMALYEILVKRVSILRILFGMRIKNESRTLQTALCVMAGFFLVLVVALMVVASNTENMSPPPTKPGLYVNEEFGFQVTFPARMNKQGTLTSNDMLFHIRHPEKTMFLKIRKNDIPVNQPLDPQAAKMWITSIMRNLGMINPEVLSTEIFTTPDGTGVLYAAIQFKTKTGLLVGAFAFADRNKKRLFIAGYNEDGVEPLEQIMKSLAFK